jgi:thiol-disulfide isomerase/thioredoxin
VLKLRIMGRTLRLILFIAIIPVCQSLQGQLVAKEKVLHIQSISNIKDTPKIIKPLSIGDHVPDVEFNMLNYSSPVARLSDFKGKLVLIDFWATWCHSCIRKFPILAKYQKEFKGKLQVLLINSNYSTGDDIAKIKGFIQKREAIDKTSFPLPVGVEDSIADKLFPHYELPHYAWISPSGIVSAITGSDEITEENIRKIIETGTPVEPLAVKRDFIPNQLMDLNLEGPIVIDESLPFYSFFKKGKLTGLSSINQARKTKVSGATKLIDRGVAMRNLSIVEMYETALSHKKSADFGEYNRKRLLLEVKDISKLFFNGKQETKETWERDNLFTYDLVIPSSEIKDLGDYIFRDLNKYSNYFGRIEKRKVKCYVLVETKKTKAVILQDSATMDVTFVNRIYHLKNIHPLTISDMLNRNTGIKLPVINKAKRKATIDLNWDALDIETVRKQLAQFGLDLIESEEHLDMLVIRDKK